MVPQLDTSYYFSQIVWLVICLTILMLFFKKVFLPKMQSTIAKRDKNIFEMKKNIKDLSKKYDGLVEELRILNENRILETKKIIHDTQNKCDQVLNEQIQQLQNDSANTIKKIRSDAENVLQNLDKETDAQIEKIAQQLFDKLFANLGNGQ